MKSLGRDVETQEGKSSRREEGRGNFGVRRELSV